MTRLLRSAAAAALALGLGAASASSAFAYERWIDINNEGPVSIWSVHITHIRTNAVGRDLLGDYTIPAGGSARVEPDFDGGYCRFDVMIAYSDGQRLNLWDVNLCDSTDIVVDGRDAWVA